MEKQGQNPNQKKDSNKKSYSKAEIAFRKDLAHNKMVWTGHCCQDFWYFFISEHAIFSWWCCAPCCGVPKQHPFSRKERLCILLIGLFWSLCWTAAIQLAQKDEEDGEEDTLDSTTSIIEDYFGEDTSVRVLETFFSLCISILLAICVRLATCSCVQGIGTTKRKCVERIGSILLILNLIVAVFFGSIMLNLAIEEDIGEKLIMGMIYQNLMAWFVWDLLASIFKFYIGFCCFCPNYRKEKKVSKEKSNTCIHWTDYAQHVEGKQLQTQKTKQTKPLDTQIQISAIN
jgi:hypothetical protein